MKLRRLSLNFWDGPWPWLAWDRRRRQRPLKYNPHEHCCSVCSCSRDWLLMWNTRYFSVIVEHVLARVFWSVELCDLILPPGSRFPKTQIYTHMWELRHTKTWLIGSSFITALHTESNLLGMASKSFTFEPNRTFFAAPGKKWDRNTDLWRHHSMLF